MTQTEKRPKPAKRKKGKQREAPGPPEDSIALRVVVCLMAIFCIVTSCSFVPTPIYLIVLYALAAVAGSYLSYHHRYEKNRLLGILTVVGVGAVIYAFGKELIDGLYSAHGFDMHVPTVHAVAGTFAMHTFELRTRKEINLSALVGLALMCLISPLAKNLYYGICVVLYICLGGIMLYYECYSRTSQSWLSKPIGNAPIIASMASDPARRRRTATGSAVTVVSLLPLLSAVLFAVMPRGDAMVDRVRAWSQLKMQDGLLQAGEFARNSASSQRDHYLPRRRRAAGKSGPAGAPGPNQADNQRNGGSSPGRPGAHVRTSGPQTMQQRVENENAEQSFSLRAPHPKTDSQVIYRVWSDRSLYLRRFCYDTCDGKDWFSSDRNHEDPIASDREGVYDLTSLPAFKPAPPVPSMTVTQKYEIEMELGKVLSVGWMPQKIASNSSTLTGDRFGTVRSPNRLPVGTKYIVVSQVPIYNLNNMRQEAPIDLSAANKIRKDLENCLQLPDSHDDHITELARTVAGQDNANWFAKAERITTYLRANYTYNAAPKPVSGNAINSFLFKEKQGDCRDFASAFVILCRCVGIPTRCVAGYIPGDFNLFFGGREVRLKHAHAWGEVYLPNYGWVPFDATPGGVMPGSESEHSYDVFKNLNGRSRAGQQTELDAMLKTFEKIVVASLATMISAFLAWNIFQRWKKWRHYELHIHPASKLYHKMLQDLKKLPVVKQPPDTPQDVQDRVAAACLGLAQTGKPRPELSDTVNEFIEIYSQCYFGDKQGKLPELQQLREKIHELVN